MGIEIRYRTVGDSAGMEMLSVGSLVVRSSQGHIAADRAADVFNGVTLSLKFPSLVISGSIFAELYS